MDKQQQYEDLLAARASLFDKELETVINQLNILATLKANLDLFWVGIYRAKPDKLVLGPYSGSLPCTKIAYGSGLCGQTAMTGKVHCVNDVTQIENYIACHPETMSEIVIPGFKDGQVAFVLDIDSTRKEAFDETDTTYLQRVAEWLASIDDQP